jgi:hypothetical protein
MVTDRLLLSDEALDCMYPGMRMELAREQLITVS